jgi:hypothetical protein
LEDTKTSGKGDDPSKSVLGFCTVGEIPVGEIPVGEIPVGEIPVGEIPVGEIPVGEIPVGEIPVGEIPVAAKLVDAVNGMLSVIAADSGKTRVANSPDSAILLEKDSRRDKGKPPDINKRGDRAT